MTVHNFISEVNNRLDKDALIRSIILALLVFSGGVLFGAIFFLLRGYAVPFWVFAFSGITSSLIGLWRYRKNKTSLETAASTADSFFDLKNGLISFLHLRKAGGAMADGQELWIQEKIRTCDPLTVPFRYSKRLAIFAGILFFGAMSFSLIPTSEGVKVLQEEQSMTITRSKEAVEKIQKVVEEMDRDLSEEERVNLNIDDLKKQVDSLQPSQDRKEVTRQFAKLEERTREMSKSLKQAEDEQTLKRAVAELKKSLNTETKELGDMLSRNDMSKANKKLDALIPKAQPEKLTKKDIEHAKQKLNKLREVTKRLANASEQSTPNEKKSSLRETMKALDQSAKKMEQNLKEQELAQMRQEQTKSKNYNQNQEQLRNHMNGLQKKLGQLKGKKSGQKRLQGLAKSLAKSQRFVNGQSDSLFLKPANGLKPGSAVLEKKKPLGEELLVKGNESQLSGQQGQGPSDTKVEEAQSGTGVSSKIDRVTSQSMERQLESFVQRDDVPEQLKQGVKEYFKTIHEE